MSHFHAPCTILEGQTTQFTGWPWQRCLTAAHSRLWLPPRACLYLPAGLGSNSCLPRILRLLVRLVQGQGAAYCGLGLSCLCKPWSVLPFLIYSKLCTGTIAIYGNRDLLNCPYNCSIRENLWYKAWGLKVKSHGEQG